MVFDLKVHNDHWIISQFVRLPMWIRKRDYKEYAPQVSHLNKELFDLLCEQITAAEASPETVSLKERLEKKASVASNKRKR